MPLRLSAATASSELRLAPAFTAVKPNDWKSTLWAPLIVSYMPRGKTSGGIRGKITTFFPPTATVTVSGTQAGTTGGQIGSTKVQTPLQVWSASHRGPHGPIPPTRHLRSDSLRTRTPSRQVK